MSYETFQKVITLLQEITKIDKLSYLGAKEWQIILAKNPQKNPSTIDPFPSRKAGSGKHLNIVMSDDFDEPLADFAEYM